MDADSMPKGFRASVNAVTEARQEIVKCGNCHFSVNVFGVSARKCGILITAMDTSRRSAFIERKTKETNISLSLDLDGTGAGEIDTGIGFFNHMLELLKKHALVDLTVKCAGDLDVDYHHTVEDVGLVLGQALNRALRKAQCVGHAGLAARGPHPREADRADAWGSVVHRLRLTGLDPGAVAVRVAEVKGVDVEELLDITCRNGMEMYGII